MTGRITTWWKRTYEGLRGALFVLPCLTEFCEIPVVVLLVGFVGGGVWVCFLVVFLLSGNFCTNLLSIPKEFPGVDRPRHVLVRQCREKKHVVTVGVLLGPSGPETTPARSA